MKSLLLICLFLLIAFLLGFDLGKRYVPEIEYPPYEWQAPDKPILFAPVLENPASLRAFYFACVQPLSLNPMVVPDFFVCLRAYSPSAFPLDLTQATFARDTVFSPIRTLFLRDCVQGFGGTIEPIELYAFLDCLGEFAH